jgi:protein-S-isoprenylcysteine O-methyltransferase Ste14
MIGMGIIGFILMYLSDVNQIVWRLKVLKPLFAIGFVFVFASTVLIVSSNFVDILSVSESVILLISFLLSTIMLVYILFFAIPFDDSYITQFNERKAYKERVYALTRHPGIIPFTLMYLIIAYALKSNEVTIFSVIMILMNVMYVYLQDKYFFPKLFSDYDIYKQQTPFLIPNKTSVKKAIKTYRKGE